MVRMVQRWRRDGAEWLERRRDGAEWLGQLCRDGAEWLEWCRDGAEWLELGNCELRIRIPET